MTYDLKEQMREWDDEHFKAAGQILRSLRYELRNTTIKNPITVLDNFTDAVGEHYKQLWKGESH